MNNSTRNNLLIAQKLYLFDLIDFSLIQILLLQKQNLNWLAQSQVLIVMHMQNKY